MEQAQQQAADTPAPSSSRKRGPREGETESQRHKREKAAERQRRKRERDRRAGLEHILSALETEGLMPPSPASPPVPDRRRRDDDLTEEEAARREKVRAAARERQRKHRALVKQRKMRELGIDMGNDVSPAMEEMQFRIDENGMYPPMFQPEVQHPPHLHPAMAEPPFPQGQVNGGQTFASTLLLSFSCAPLLKAHLLRTLNMSNDELASFEPIIAQAWDHWDQQRRMHYGGPKPPEGQVADNAQAGSSTLVQGYPAVLGGHPPPYPIHDPVVAQGPGSTNDFRERFHRPLLAPSPFRSSVLGGASTPPQGVGPSLTTGNTNQPSKSPTLESSASGQLDPQLGQARDEAVGVADRLARND